MAEDISRNGFDPAKGYVAVRLQQGRVWLDADFNEQADIVRHRLQQTVVDLIGASGAPAYGGGFEVQADNVLCFDGSHAAFAPPHQELRFADAPFRVELRCEPSAAGADFGGTLLAATDTRGHVHFSLAIDAAGNVIVHRHGERVLVAPARWHGPRSLRVHFDGLVLGVSVDDEHAAHVHFDEEAEQWALLSDDEEHEHRGRLERHPVQLPVGILVGMGLVEGERCNGFRGAIESLAIHRGSAAGERSIACWPLDEGLGTVAADTSGHGHHLQLDYGEASAHPRWQNRSLTLSEGRFYVDGAACHAEHRMPLPEPVTAGDAPTGASLVYLDAWERVVTAAEAPGLRDAALGGVDTAARLRLHQRVRTLQVGKDPFVEPESPVVQRAWRRLLSRHESGALRVRSQKPASLRDGCYRVEIHHAGARLETGDASRMGSRVRARHAKGRQLELVRGEGSWEAGQWCAAVGWSAQILSVSAGESTLEVSQAVPEAFGTGEFWLRPLATFKWSRNNASDQWPVQHAEARGVSVLPVPGRQLALGDLIEISDRERREAGRPGAIASIVKISDDRQRLGLDVALPALGDGLLLTRWHGAALLPVSGAWTRLEHGLEVQFNGPRHAAGAGWGFATREADGSLDWPLQPAASEHAPQPAWQTPRDGRHHLALLALLQRDAAGVSVRDLRNIFAPLGEGAPTPAPAERRTPPERRPEPEPRHVRVETLRHVGRETQIDDGVIHGRQLAGDVGVVPPGAAILSERERPPAGFEFTGQSLRSPHPDPRWQRFGAPPGLREHAVLLAVPSGVLALVPDARVWHLSHGEERWRDVAEMPARLHDFAAAALGEQVHLVGGREGQGPPLPWHWVLEGGQWRRRTPPLRVARAQHGLAVLAGRLLAFGGVRSAFFSWRTRDQLARWGLSPRWVQEHSTASVEAYDEQRDSWQEQGSLPVDRAQLASAVCGDRLHVLGGRRVPLLGRARPAREHFELSARTGRWRRREPLTSAKAAAAAGLLGEHLYLIGGETQSGPLAEVERLHLAREDWEPQRPLPRARSGASVAVSSGTLLCAGGSDLHGAADGMLACTLETILYVHRRSSQQDLAAGDAPARPAETAPIVSKPAPPAAQPSPPAAPPSPPPIAPAAPPPSSHAVPASQVAPPSSLSAVVAPPAPASAASAAHLQLPHTIAQPPQGLGARLAALRTKAQQVAPVTAIALLAGLIGSGRTPDLVRGAREQLITWLTPSSAGPSSAVGASGAAGASATWPAVPSSVPAAPAAAGAPALPAPLGPPAPPSVAALQLGDPSALYARGVDVSHYQGVVPWQTLIENGIDYAFTKATQGTGYHDPRFNDNWSGLRAHGILRGAYHVWEPDEDAIAQAKFFAGIIGADSDLPPVIDVELVSRKKKCPELLADIQEFAITVEQLLGQVIAIYSYGDYWSTYLSCNSDPTAAAIASNLALRPLWVADYDHPQDPSLFGGHLGWDFWQYSEHGKELNEQMDLDRFSGGPQDLRRWLTRRMRPPVGR